MAYDERLADRVRKALATTRSVAEIKMFGGLCFTVRGNMAVGVNRDGLMVRLASDEHEAALGEPGVRPMEMGGRTMKGFLIVEPSGLGSGRLGRWVNRGVAYATSLPPKTPKKPTKRP